MLALGSDLELVLFVVYLFLRTEISVLWLRWYVWGDAITCHWAQKENREHSSFQSEILS